MFIIYLFIYLFVLDLDLRGMTDGRMDEVVQ
jgi:hypothetical protein